MKPAPKFVQVIVPAPLKEPLTYSVPESLGEQMAPGKRVLVPLRRRIVTGIVLEPSDGVGIKETKPVDAVLDEQPILDRELLKLAQWLSRYYLAPLGDVVATMLPRSWRRESQRTVRLRPTHGQPTDESCAQVLRELERLKGKATVKTLARKFPRQPIEKILTRLQASGAVEIEEHLPKQRRGRYEFPSAETDQVVVPATALALTAAQKTALGAVEERIQRGGFEVFLLHGVTGSGKTEVYLRAAERTQTLGRRSLILIPEISLTPQLLDRIGARFGKGVGVLHSALTDAERWAHWRRIARGDVDIVVGARSAVFAPIPDLGLIIVDEEHDPSYKQDDGLRYNGRDVAVVRAKFLGCPIILGSATPSLESYENCRQGRYRLLEISQRVEERPLPVIETVDLRARFDGPARNSDSKPTAEREERDRALFSDTLIEALKRNFEAGRQTLIFLNRRGFANFLQCALCGYVWHCPHCSVTLTVHRRKKIISCHHCEYRRPITETCPECNQPALAGVGSGTERIEEALRRVLPQARIARMDRDTTAKRGSQEALIRRWEKGEIDILVGTQMITKGHDVSGVTLVGAVLADLSLNLPDFRAAERTFQLLSQVAGRSGRGDDPGRMIVQTFAPDHYVFEYLIAHDYAGFFRAESEFRRALDYPPFSRLVSLRLDGPKAEEVEKTARALADRLYALKQRESKFRAQIDLLGPAPAPIERLRDRYRWQFLARAKHSTPLLEFARRARQLMPSARAVRLHIDVDPYSML